MHGFTDLEDRINAADGASTLRSSLASVRAITGELREAIAAGLGQPDFERAEMILAAAAAAEHILLKTARAMGA